MLTWKRKGGRATAQGAGMQFVVEDDGRYRVRLPAGEWLPGEAADVAAAKVACERAADTGEVYRQREAAELDLRRWEARRAEERKRVVTDRERRWAEDVGHLMAMWVHRPLLRPEMQAAFGRLPGDARTLIEAWTADATVVAGLASFSEGEAERRVARSIVESLADGRLRGEFE